MSRSLDVARLSVHIIAALHDVFTFQCPEILSDLKKLQAALLII